ncbi:DUF2125 domain-containing protein [Pseudooceanicola sp.]|uniref:DUF2125 domain-containing protein n=1 Tax=Pseudooceanicola sp. TaxID=1914328 RepID=UPI0035C6C312
MKRLFFIVIAVALLWSGYWIIGASGVKSGLTAWFDARRAEGWVAEYDDLAVQGYPNRFDATWTNMTLADPDTGIAWTLPRFQLLALSYQPNHVIAAWPSEMQVATPLDKLDITSDRLRASLRLNPGTALELERMVLEGHDIAFSGADTGSLEELHLAAERTGEASYRLGLDGRNLSPPAPLLQAWLGNQALPETLQMARLDATVVFDRPWDITALEDSRPQPVGIDLTNMRAEWGVMELQAKGRVEIDARGRPSGKVSLQAVHWQDLLEIARASGALTDSAAAATRTVLDLAAKSAGNPNSIDVELTFEDGLTYIGFVPIGPAPYIYLQ